MVPKGTLSTRARHAVAYDGIFATVAGISHDGGVELAMNFDRSVNSDKFIKFRNYIMNIPTSDGSPPLRP